MIDLPPSGVHVGWSTPFDHMNELDLCGQSHAIFENEIIIPMIQFTFQREGHLSSRARPISKEGETTPRAILRKEKTEATRAFAPLGLQCFFCMHHILT